MQLLILTLLIIRYRSTVQGFSPYCRYFQLLKNKPQSCCDGASHYIYMCSSIETRSYWSPTSHKASWDTLPCGRATRSSASRSEVWTRAESNRLPLHCKWSVQPGKLRARVSLRCPIKGAWGIKKPRLDAGLIFRLSRFAGTRRQNYTETPLSRLKLCVWLLLMKNICEIWKTISQNLPCILGKEYSNDFSLSCQYVPLFSLLFLNSKSLELWNLEKTGDALQRSVPKKHNNSHEHNASPWCNINSSNVLSFFHHKNYTQWIPLPSSGMGGHTAHTASQYTIVPKAKQTICGWRNISKYGIWSTKRITSQSPNKRPMEKNNTHLVVCQNQWWNGNTLPNKSELR